MENSGKNFKKCKKFVSKSRKVSVNWDEVEKLKKFSKRDETVIDEGYEVGIDEAGRGPVIGPMIYGGLAWPVRLRSQLAKIGFADSKKIKTQEQREDFFKAIEKLPIIEFGYKTISAQKIANTHFSQTNHNLNTLSHNSAITLIEDFINSGLTVKKAFVDTVGPPEKYKMKLEKYFEGKDIEFFVESKADDKFPVTSAASVVAKVQRDRAIEDWKFLEKLDHEDRDYGTGYTSQVPTKNWLKRNWHPLFGYPNIVRFNWSTVFKDMYQKQDFTLKYLSNFDQMKKSNNIFKQLKKNDGKSNNEEVGTFMESLGYDSEICL